MPFVAKFCPVKFGWENALLLNAMQKIYEDDWAAEWSEHGGSLFFNSGYSFSPICLLQENQFSELTGSVADADRLSLKYFRDRFSVVWHIRFPRGDAMIAVEYARIFNVGTKGTVLPEESCATVNNCVYNSIAQLRRDLFQRFFYADPAAETAVFSPVRYGLRDALMLNCLQSMMVVDHDDAAGDIGRRTKQGLFTRPSGTEFEADYLSFYYCDREDHICGYVFSDELGDAFRSAFLIGDRMGRRQVMRVINREMIQLRIRLYSLPRSIAFLMGRHARLGSAPALPDDVCRMILALSVE
jgi:hypothetical protein